ncbi:MAG TPA: energy transducer TonB [Mucilaginibacter sp.]
MKHIYLLFFLILISKLTFAQTPLPDALITEDSIPDRVPEFPGGTRSFYNYISQNVHYSDIANLIGITGRVVVSFVVNKEGEITRVTPVNCIGAGCEAEAVKVIEQSPDWKPGIYNGRLVNVIYNIPITFDVNDRKVTMANLRKSNYGFVFSIKGSLYTIDEAEKILGGSFMSTQIEIAVPFYNYNKISKFDTPDKKEIYLLVFKSKKD